MDDFLTFLYCCGMGFAALMAAIVIMMVPVEYYAHYQCDEYSKLTGFETSWIFLDKCYVHVGDEIVPQHYYLSVLIAKRKLKNDPR